ELQSAYVDELEKNEEFKNEIKRLREMISGLASTLQRLSRAVDEVKPNPISYQATDFVQDLRTKIEHDFPNESTEISWDIQHGGELHAQYEPNVSALVTTLTLPVSGEASEET